jgi:hypothetical protein
MECCNATPGGLYFPVNSRNVASAAAMNACLQIVADCADAAGSEPGLHCKSLQIAADFEVSCGGPDLGAGVSLLRETLAVA